MLKSDILAQFEKAVRSNLSADFDILTFDQVYVSLVHRNTKTSMDLELSDTRIIVKFNLSAVQFISENSFRNISRLSTFIRAEPILFKGDREVGKLKDADQLYIYSDFIDISEAGEIAVAMEELLNIVFLAACTANTDLSPDRFKEGAEYFSNSKKLERSSAARKRAVELHGVNCAVCNLNFEAVYGDIGKEYIHIHHLTPISNAGYNEINPDTDLVPVCPNCHAMIHKESPPIPIQKMKEILKK